MLRLTTRSICLGLLLAAFVSAIGCRAIGRFGESRPTIAARRLSRLGVQRIHDGQWDAAESLFADALEISGSDERAHAGMAETLWQRGELKAAVEHLEQAVRLSAADPKHVIRLGRMYLELGELDKANRQCDAALEAERDSALAWTLRADCLRAAGENERALAAYHRALALRPDAPNAHLQAAEIYFEQGRYDRLLATVDRLQENVGAQRAPARSDMLRGIAMRELGRHQEARRCFVQATDKDPTDPTPHLQLASLSLVSGDVDGARIALDRAIELDPAAVSHLDHVEADKLRQLGTSGPRVVVDQEPDDAGFPVRR